MKKDGYEIKIYPDYDYPSPLDWDMLGTFVHWHTRLDMGNDRIDKPENQKEYDQLVKSFEGVVLPVYVPDHGQIQRQIGFIYVKAVDVRKEYKVERISLKLRETVKQLLTSEIEVWSDWISGDVYSYEIVFNGEVIDSCGGFFGSDHKHLLEHAKYFVEHHKGIKL